MKTLTLWSLVALAGWALVLGGCAAGKPGAAREPLPAVQLAGAGLVTFWYAELPLESKTHEQVLQIYRQPNRIYAITSDNRLLAMDSFSGQFLWSAEIGPKQLKPTPVGQYGRAVFLGLANRLLGFSAEDGSRVFDREVEHPATTRPIINGSFAYYGTSTGWFEAQALLSSGASWNRWTDAEILAAPTYDAAQVYFANGNGRVYASRADTRFIEWEYKTNGAVVADLQRSTSGLILVASRDYTLYAFNPHNGGVAWAAITGDPLEKTPRPVGNRVYIIKKGGDLWALDEQSGARLWIAKNISDFVSASDLTLFFIDRAGRLVGLNPADGATKFSLDLGKYTFLMVNELDGQVFAASPRGQVICLREPKVTYPGPEPLKAPEEAPKTPEAAKAPEAQPPAAQPKAPATQPETPAEQPKAQE